MPIEITIPRLGWSMEEGTFGEWLKTSGEPVRAGDMVYVLEGEKAAHEIESFDAGILCIPDDAPQAGDTVLVGQVIAFLLAEGETPPATVGRPPSGSTSKSAPAVKPTVTSPTRVAGPAARRLARQLGIDLNAVPTPDPTGRVICEDVERAALLRRTGPATAGVRIFASPRARRRARELGIEWQQIRGSGRNGRIRERDVVAHSSRAAGSSIAEPLPSASGHHQPASKIRRTIAQRMLAGVMQAAPVTLTTKIDATNLIAWRTRQKTAASTTTLPGYSDIIVKLAAELMAEFPLMNSCWHRDGIFVFDSVNVAVAVDTEYGLVAPVIDDVANRSLSQIAEHSRMLIEQARAGTLADDRLRGGTFTVTNLGMFDIDLFTPILNLPQSAILGIGRIVREPVVRGDAVVPGETLSLSLTFDHRVIDGAPAARWLQRLSQRLSAPLNEFDA